MGPGSPCHMNQAQGLWVSATLQTPISDGGIGVLNATGGVVPGKLYGVRTCAARNTFAVDAQQCMADNIALQLSSHQGMD